MMLPFFAASGHRLYAKFARLYLQQMMHLSEIHPDVYKDFMTGHHVIRRSQRFWAGLSCDLTIEQTDVLPQVNWRAHERQMHG